MVGYTEALTDPSYSGQILTLTYPGGQLRRTAVVRIPKDPGHRLSCRACADYSHAARGGLPQWLRREEIPCLAGIDTARSPSGCATKGRCSARSCSTERTWLSTIRTVATSWPRLAAGSARLSRRRAHRCAGRLRAKASIIEKLRARLTIIRVPSDYDFLGEDFDGVLVSNGPGDPRSCGQPSGIFARAARRAPHHGHLPWAPAPRARRRREHLQAQVRAPRPQPALPGGRDRALLHHLAEPRLRGGSGDASGGWEAWFTNANDGSNEGCATAPGRSSACSSTRRRRPARRLRAAVR